MRFYKFSLLTMMCLFLTGLSYVKVQTEIKKTSYTISHKLGRLEDLQDQKYSLLYSFYRYASIDTENLDDLGYKFYDSKKLVRIEIPKVYQRENKALMFVKKIFSAGSTAQAEE